MIRLLILSLLGGCASPVTKDYPLIQRILRPRGDDILTWQKCVKRDLLNTCLEYEKESYDITQKDVRQNFSDLGFVCKINEVRFHICENGKKTGFCQQKFTRKFLSKRKRKLVRFIGHNEIEKLKAGRLRCFSTRVYDFRIP